MQGELDAGFIVFGIFGGSLLFVWRQCRFHRAVRC